MRMRKLLHDSTVHYPLYFRNLDQILLDLQLNQAVLEKFEFFPIKCRVQRALELFKETCERKEKLIDKSSMKQKVGLQFTMSWLSESV